MANQTINASNFNFNFPQAPFLDASGLPNIAWLIWLQNPSFNSLKVANGATGTFTSGGHTLTITNGIITNIT